MTDYVIEFALTGSAVWTIVDDEDSTATSHTISGLTDGISYQFRVLPSTAGAGPSNAVVATPRTVPGVPQALSGSIAPVTGVESGEVRLTWGPPASDGGSAVTDYAIEYALTGSAVWIVVDEEESTARSHTVSGLTNGTSYEFRVVAVNAAGAGPSNAVVATPRTTPTTPRNLTATPTNLSGQVRLAWTAPESDGGSQTNYVIQRMVDPSAGWLTVTATVPWTATSHTETRVRVTGPATTSEPSPSNAAGDSAPSTVVDATPRAVPTAAWSLTAAPTNRSGQVRLAWTAPSSNGGSAITDYVIQRMSGSSWVTINDGVSTTTSFTVTGLGNGTRYYFRVLAKNAAGSGPSSNVANQIPRTVPTAERVVHSVSDEPVRADPPGVDGAVVERRCGDHRLRHPTPERVVVGDDQRRRAHNDHLHRDRFAQRSPLLLPSSCQERCRHWTIEQCRQPDPTHRAEQRREP